MLDLAIAGHRLAGKDSLLNPCPRIHGLSHLLTRRALV
jgi:hypothetical protein